jgi:hypothetical protein
MLFEDIHIVFTKHLVIQNIWGTNRNHVDLRVRNSLHELLFSIYKQHRELVKTREHYREQRRINPLIVDFDVSPNFIYDLFEEEVSHLSKLIKLYFNMNGILLSINLVPQSKWDSFQYVLQVGLHLNESDYSLEGTINLLDSLPSTSYLTRNEILVIPMSGE